MKAKEHLKKIKGTIDVERGYSLGTVFTTRNKQYMYDTGTGKVFECGANEYQILKSLFEQTSSISLKTSGNVEMGYKNSNGVRTKKYSGSGKSHSTTFTIGSTGYYKFYITNKSSGTITITGGSLNF